MELIRNMFLLATSGILPDGPLKDKIQADLAEKIAPTFGENADYYLNGTDKQPGLNEIAKNMLDGASRRVDEINALQGGPKGTSGGPS